MAQLAIKKMTTHLPISVFLLVLPSKPCLRVGRNRRNARFVVQPVRRRRRHLGWRGASVAIFADNLPDRLQRVAFVDSGRFALFEHCPDFAGAERSGQVLLLLDGGTGRHGLVDGRGCRRADRAAATATVAGSGRHGFGRGHHLYLPLVAFLLLALLESHLWADERRFMRKFTLL